MKLLGALALALALTACSSPTGESGGTSEGVPWKRYSPEVRERVKVAVRSGDCVAMQDEFDAADANDERQRAKYGEGNADLMDYLDKELEEAGCY